MIKYVKVITPLVYITTAYNKKDAINRFYNHCGTYKIDSIEVIE